MAGHSKWANIQHRKKAQDSKRGKVFTRLIREIGVAARQAGGDPGANPRLRQALEKANAANVPKDTIERTIKKATGEAEGVTYEEIRYEGYAAGGVAVLVDCVTDNRNRTVAEVRHAFSKYAGNLGTEGSVGYLFNKAGVITFAPGNDEDAVMEQALEAGAEDIISGDDGAVEVLTDPRDLEAVKSALDAAGLIAAESEVTMRAETQVELDLETAQKALRLIDALEDMDDTQAVYSNGNFPAEAFD